MQTLRPNRASPLAQDRWRDRLRAGLVPADPGGAVFGCASMGTDGAAGDLDGVGADRRRQ